MPVGQIYKIVNIVNDRAYIGQTINFRKRKNDHLMRLRRGIHANDYLQKAFAKYGEESFKFEIIEEVERDNLTEREQYWSDSIGDYNLLVDVRSPWYGPKAEEHKRKISEAHIGVFHTEDTKKKISEKLKGMWVGHKSPNSVSVKQYDKNMNLIKVHKCITEAANDTQINRKSISNNANGRSNSAGGFVWQLKAS